MLSCEIFLLAFFERYSTVQNDQMFDHDIPSQLEQKVCRLIYLELSDVVDTG
jgi:hypothetical protein